MQVWLGYQQSLRPVQGSLSLNVDLAATAFLEVPLIATSSHANSNANCERRPLLAIATRLCRHRQQCTLQAQNSAILLDAPL